MRITVRQLQRIISESLADSMPVDITSVKLIADFVLPESAAIERMGIVSGEESILRSGTVFSVTRDVSDARPDDGVYYISKLGLEYAEGVIIPLRMLDVATGSATAQGDRLSDLLASSHTNLAALAEEIDSERSNLRLRRALVSEELDLLDALDKVAQLVEPMSAALKALAGAKGLRLPTSTAFAATEGLRRGLRRRLR